MAFITAVPLTSRHYHGQINNHNHNRIHRHNGAKHRTYRHTIPPHRSLHMCDKATTTSSSSSLAAQAKDYKPDEQTPTSSSLFDFSSNISSLQNEGAYAVLSAARRLEREQGAHIIHMEIGQPCFDTPSHITDAGVAALKSGHTRYSLPAGEPNLREVIATYSRQIRGLDYVQAENVVVGPGAKPGLFFCTLALVRPTMDDVVVIPDPGFPTYEAMATVAGARVRRVGIRDEDGQYDVDELEKIITEEEKGNGKVRMVVLNSPSNPTGMTMNRRKLERVANLAKSHDFWVISDEIYSQLVYIDENNNENESIAKIKGMQDRVIIIDGFSKSFCMTGWRLGWAIMPVELARRVEVLLVHAVGCTATFTQHAGIVALQNIIDGHVQELENMRAQLKRRRNMVVQQLNAMDGVHCNTPQGAFYAWVDIRQLGLSSKQVANLLLQKGKVAVLPGSDFGSGGEGYIRISYVTSEEELEEGINRIKKTLDVIRKDQNNIMY